MNRPVVAAVQILARREPRIELNRGEQLPYSLAVKRSRSDPWEVVASRSSRDELLTWINQHTTLVSSRT
jgi:hypothetical protein